MVPRIRTWLSEFQTGGIGCEMELCFSLDTGVTGFRSILFHHSAVEKAFVDFFVVPVDFFVALEPGEVAVY